MPVKPLFDLRVTHPFYDDQRCSDLAIAATEPTAGLMRRLGLVCRQFSDHVSLYAHLNEAGESIASAAAPLVLDFVLSPRSETFALITDLDPLAGQAAPLFTNIGVAPADPLPLRLASRVAHATETLTVALPGPTETFVLAGRPQAGAVATAFSISPPGVAATVTGYEPTANRISVNTSGTSAGARLAVTYPVRPARPRDLLAEVELSLDGPSLQPPAAGPRAYLVPLAVRMNRWCYYLLTDYAGDISTLRIVDATPGTGPRSVVFGDAGRVDLSHAPDTADSVAVDLAKRHPGRRLLRFLSDAPVACRQSPVRALELHLGDIRVLGALPNPSPANFARVSTTAIPAAPATVLYTVLRLIAN